MAKANVIFRRIRGKLVPISTTAKKTDKNKVRLSSEVDGVEVGSLRFSGVKKRKNSVNVDMAVVNPSFQGIGISSNMFKQVMKLAKRMKKKFVRGEDIIAPEQIKIRKKYKTRYLFSDDFGEEKSRMIDAGTAQMILENSPTVRYGIRAVTKV